MCNCVVVLKGGGKEPNWKNAKAMMSDTGFLRSLVEFDKDSLGDRQIKTVNNTLKQSSLSPEDVKNVSQAAAGLLKWVFASEHSPFPILSRQTLLASLTLILFVKD